ncbi:hypothetical protein GYMLUDRAFT_247687 [Collybiopsis luxurians FD-317 M1]|uniref:Uncharacterized protein n=1 Tax=Collybiopsis luxurians FD-317 M1 TaxID=944289 RepID=A0A0D0B0R1_9AGAR|nr:hypothetical protein GYMLUDRAFT_247687 [Collybiopsis luxurians FD-317 M1]
MTLSSGSVIRLSVSEVSSMISNLQSVQNVLISAATSEKENCEAWVPPSTPNQDPGEIYNRCVQVQIPAAIGEEQEVAQGVWDSTQNFQWGKMLNQHPDSIAGSISSLDTDGQSEVTDPSTIAFTVSSSSLDSMLVSPPTPPPPPPPTPVNAATHNVSRWSLAHMLVYKVKGGIMQLFGSYSEASGEFELSKDLGLFLLYAAFNPTIQQAFSVHMIKSENFLAARTEGSMRLRIMEPEEAAAYLIKLRLRPAPPHDWWWITSQNFPKNLAASIKFKVRQNLQGKEAQEPLL